MRTLLVDNYDSYTYNLYQLLAEVNGRAPVVVRNDAAEWDELDLDSFDNVVVSPGPGHPGRPRDFGRCAELIATTSLPLLGVCLGHQGIGWAAGAQVGPAPEPRHGYLSRIRHSDDALFAGIPQDFVGVRYHSLCLLEPLPDGVRATAWAEDGVIMALRHERRPQWGVQFHPESVATEHGGRLLANFRDLSRTGTRSSLPTARATSSFPASPKMVRRFTVRYRTIDVEVDAERVFAALYADSPYAFWLDSSLIEAGRSRFSFLGDTRGPHSETLTYRVGKGSVRVRSADGSVGEEPGTIFDVLTARLGALDAGDPALPFSLAGGYVGYFGYELKGEIGATNRHMSQVPDAIWMFADRLVVVDHLERRTYLVALVAPGQAAPTGWFEATAAVLGSLPPLEPVADEPMPSMVDLVASLDRDESRYLADVERCQQLLRAGESYEICLTNAARWPAPADPWAFYRRMRRRNPAPYGVYLRAGELVVAGSSPELFLRVEDDGRVLSKPIKGTAARRADPDEDIGEARALAGSGKARAENLMIVDLVRNDLGRVCDVGSVTVRDFMAVESYATVHQLVSTIEGQLRAGVTAIECVRACFPGGSMTGAPKLRTMEIIDAIEDEPRGVYSGAIGFLGADGSAELSIVIRTAVIHDAVMRIGAGGAIVLDSEAHSEFAEMLLKAAAPMGGLGVEPSLNPARPGD